MAELHPDLQALIGSVIHERYRVDALLGQGGMGAVLRGRHLGLARDVAIKVLRPELGRSDATSKRFDREAHSASRLDHPNCVRVFDFGTTEGGIKYLVMELLAGAELEASLGQPWAPARAVDTIVQIFEGLEHAHHCGIVHRDLKPENVFVTTDFRGREIIKLVDFGIAKLIDEDGAKEQLTRAGMVFGTPRYMSPEQATGGKLDERTDLYAAGLILYEMLAGKPPFVAEEASILLRMHILAPPPALPPSVPAPLAAVVLKLLEKSRNDRYASAREVIDTLVGLRPQLEHASAAVVAAPVLAPTGPIATPSMATHAEPSAPPGTGWNAAAPPTSNPGASTGWNAAAPPTPNAGASTGWNAAAPPTSNAGASIGFAPTPLAMPPAPAIAVAAPVAPPPPPTASAAGWSTQEPNAATGPQASSDPNLAITSAASMVAQPRPAKPARPWLPWAITAGAIMLALMAFGAGQALQQQDSPSSDSNSSEPASTKEPPSKDTSKPAVADPFGSYDRQCSNRDSCELSCAKGCTAGCTDAERCEISVGPDSRVFCDRFETCEVRCAGDCEVVCPQGGCEVSCAHPNKKEKKGKKPKRCGSSFVCGECDDD